MAGLEIGMVQVYTGDGKGKTTAAFGVALRAAGRGLRTYVVQFMKGQEYGEVEAAEALAHLITIFQAGRRAHVNLHDPEPVDRELAERGLDLAREVIAKGEHDVVILDEINLAVYCKLLCLEDVLSLIHTKPAAVELILTGRYAPPALLEAADLVTEMREVKHYFGRGVLSRPGIDV